MSSPPENQDQRSTSSPGSNPAAAEAEVPLRIAVSGELDLHTFRPRDLPELLPAWFEECRVQGILTVRVIHGKGGGHLRQGVHALLERMAKAGEKPSLQWSFPAPESAGGWGATMVRLLME